MSLPAPYYQDDFVTLYHGDCRELLPHIEADVLVTDPPYGIGANRMTLGNGRIRLDRGDLDWDRRAADVAPLLDLGLPTIIWGGNYFSLPPASRWLVWDKGTGKNDFADCELAWTNLPGVVKKFYRLWVGSNARQHSEGMRFHPTQKPLELMEWCLGLVPDGIVLDPFAGSGSTLRAAKDLGRKAVGIEVEEKYCQIAAERCAQDVLDLGAAA